jgi:hypothetical protein
LELLLENCLLASDSSCEYDAEEVQTVLACGCEETRKRIDRSHSKTGPFIFITNHVMVTATERAVTAKPSRRNDVINCDNNQVVLTGLLGSQKSYLYKNIF